MRPRTLLALIVLGFAAPAFAELSINIGINLRTYPDFVVVPGYPVYYAPQSAGNVFFYDGLYWVYADDRWYSSEWYDGPWESIEPYAVPLFVLRVPVRYYRRPPIYFRGWIADAPPRWGEHWGGSWQQQRRGWDQWNRSAIPDRAPLPVYQRNYSGDRYPHGDQQRALRQQNYHYQQRDPVVREHVQQAAPQPQQQPRQQPPRPMAPAAHDNRMQQSNPRQPQEDRQPHQEHQPHQEGQPHQQQQPQPQREEHQRDRSRDEPGQRDKGNSKGDDKRDEPKP